MTTTKALTLTLDDIEHICAALHQDGSRFNYMSVDPDYASSWGGRWTTESAIIWKKHSDYLHNLAYQIKDQSGLPR